MKIPSSAVRNPVENVIEMEELDAQGLRAAFGSFPSGVTAFCGMVDGMPQGMAASSFTSVSLDPALVSVCVARTSATWAKLAHLDRLGLSVLASEHGEVARRLASKDADRFAGVDWAASSDGAVFVARATLWLECAPYEVVTAGDHDIVLLEVTSLSFAPDVEPMVFHRSTFWGLAAPPASPTAQ